MTSPTPTAEMIERANTIRVLFECLIIGNYSGAALVEGLNKIETAIASALAAEAALALEQAAKITEAPTTGVQINRFICDGRVLTDEYGSEHFISTTSATKLLRQRATDIRSLIPSSALEKK